MNKHYVSTLIVVLASLNHAAAQLSMDPSEWPTFDRRDAQVVETPAPVSAQQTAIARLQAQIPGLVVDFDGLLGTPAFLRANGFLSRPAEDVEKWPPLPPGLSVPFS